MKRCPHGADPRQEFCNPCESAKARGPVTHREIAELTHRLGFDIDAVVELRLKVVQGGRVAVEATLRAPWISP